MKDYAPKNWLKPVSKLRAQIARMNLCSRIREKKAMQQLQRQIEIDMAASRLMEKMQERARDMGPKHILYYSVQRSSGDGLRIGRRS